MTPRHDAQSHPLQVELPSDLGQPCRDEEAGGPAVVEDVLGLAPTEVTVERCSRDPIVEPPR